MAMRDPYLDALEQLDQMRDRAFEAEATIQRVRDVCDVTVKVDGDPSVQHGWDEAIKSVLRALDGGAE